MIGHDCDRLRGFKQDSCLDRTIVRSAGILELRVINLLASLAVNRVDQLLTLQTTSVGNLMCTNDCAPSKPALLTM